MGEEPKMMAGKKAAAKKKKTDKPAGAQTQQQAKKDPAKEGKKTKRGGQKHGGQKKKKNEEAQEGKPKGPVDYASRLDAAKLGTAELESIVFGKSVSELTSGSQETLPQRQKKRKQDGKLAKDRAAPINKKEAAWKDEDDETLQVDLQSSNRLQKLKRANQERKLSGRDYEKRLRDQFVKLHGNAKWAEEKTNIAESESESEDDEGLAQAVIPTSAKTVTGEAGGMLKPHELDIRRLKDVHVAPDQKNSESAINALQFHPNSELMLTAGFDKRLNLFSVDGDENARVSSHYFKKWPIEHASFSPDGEQILMTGRDYNMWGLEVRTGTPFEIRPRTCQNHRHLYGLALGSNPSESSLRSSKLFSVMGTAGTVMICDLATKHPVRTLRMSTPGHTQVFSTARDTLFTADQECNLYEWDLGTGRCMQRFREPWATKITHLAMNNITTFAPTPYLSVGTGSGNIDIFDVGGPKFPKEPTKSIGNLTTHVDWLRYHPTGEILVGASRDKQNAMRLVHMGTKTVFENWPSAKTPLHRVSAVDFAKRDGLMAIGNEKGQVLIYQLHDFIGGQR